MGDDMEKGVIKNTCFIGAGHVGKFNVLFSTLLLLCESPQTPLLEKEEEKL